MRERLRQYRDKALRDDLLAAFIVAILLIPQSLAYALLAGLPAEPIYGMTPEAGLGKGFVYADGRAGAGGRGEIEGLAGEDNGRLGEGAALFVVGDEAVEVETSGEAAAEAATSDDAGDEPTADEPTADEPAAETGEEKAEA